MVSTKPADLLSTLLHPSWCQALTLAERLLSLRAHPAGEAAEVARGSDLAERRLRKWKAQPPFERASFFAERLALDSATEDELRILLGEPVESLQARTAQPSEWLNTLTRAFAILDPSEHFDQLDAKQDEKLGELLHPLTPLLKHGVKRLLAGIQALVEQNTSLPFDERTIGSLLFSRVLNQILPTLVKTLTLELNIARLQESLQGETPEERFHSFVQQLCEPGAMLTLLELYPVLARLLVTIIDQGVAYGLELLEHLCKDWTEICQRLAQGQDPDILVAAHFGAGDTHRQGRSVAVLTFRSGLKLLYKPRSLAIDTHFQALLTWLNERGEHPAFRAVQVVDKGDYGWSAYVQEQGCTSAEQIARFYERLGGYLALMYAFGGTDLHFENVIACGEHPMLIDLETLFQPYLPMQSDNDLFTLPQGVAALQASVIRLGLLPQRIWATNEGDGIDISGLGGKGGQLTPNPVALLEEIGTDQMRLVRQRVTIQDQQNRPTLNDDPVNTLDYIDQVIAGFTGIYRLLMLHREELLEQILPLFAGDEIRVILRPTRSYGRLLEESLHPTLLRNALDRDRFLDHLWAQVPGNPCLSRVIMAEIDDVRGNDIPIFTSRPDSRSLFSSRGDGVASFFDESGLMMVERRIQQLDEQDLARQMWIIRASFATQVMGDEQATWKSPRLHQAGEEASQERLLQAARAVGDRLCELAIHGDHEISWLSLQLVRERVWALSVTGLDLYSGSAGICLFLAYLGAVTNASTYTTLARQVVDTLHDNIEKINNDILSPGAFTGWGGLLYLYTHLAILWQDAALLRRAEGLIERLAGTIEKDDLFDVLGGVAGGIRGLLTLYRAVPSPRLLNAALRCGDHLLEHAAVLPAGAGWPTAIAKDLPLTGYSHGAAGIALSLLELAALSGEERFRQTALAAMAYERSLFSPEMRNWPDLRPPETGGSTESGYMVAWCHGAPGIGLARLGALAYLDDTATREEITLALQTTLAQGFNLNHSLCHGDLGNLDVLLVASQVLHDPRYSTEVARLAARLLESIEREGWCTGVPLGVETPGLMTGIAGIGYELLRLAQPDQIPSVLLLAPPCWMH